jgi:TolA-binding protein
VAKGKSSQNNGTSLLSIEIDTVMPSSSHTAGSSRAETQLADKERGIERLRQQLKQQIHEVEKAQKHASNLGTNILICSDNSCGRNA